MGDRRDYGGYRDGYRDRNGWNRNQRDTRSRDSRGGRGGWREDRQTDWEKDRKNSRCDRSRAYDEARDEQPGSCNIWIGGLPSDITEREIERVCLKFGPVQSVSIKHSERDTYAFVNYGQPSHGKEAIRRLDQTDPFSTGTIKVAPASKKSDPRPQEFDDHRGYNGAKRSNGGGNGFRDHGGSDWGKGRQNGYQKGSGKGRGRSWSRGRSRSRERERSSPPRQKPAPRPVRVYLSQLPRDMEEDELQEIAAEYGPILQYELHREGAYKCGWVEYANKSEAEAAVAELDDRRMDDWTMRLQAYMYPGGGA